MISAGWLNVSRTVVDSCMPEKLSPVTWNCSSEFRRLGTLAENIRRILGTATGEFSAGDILCVSVRWLIFMVIAVDDQHKLR